MINTQDILDEFVFLTQYINEGQGWGLAEWVSECGSIELIVERYRTPDWLEDVLIYSYLENNRIVVSGTWQDIQAYVELQDNYRQLYERVAALAG